MFEKEAEGYVNREYDNSYYPDCNFSAKQDAKTAFKDGAEFGYNKANEDVKHDLMMKLKDEGIVKVLKDSIFCNKKLSSQEQQELCAWVECAIDFGENLDECAKELEEANKANEWHYVKDGEYPTDDKKVLCILGDFEHDNLEVGYYSQVEGDSKRWRFEDYDLPDDSEEGWGVSAWKEIVLPELSKEIE